MTDVLRPILELSIIIPGMLIAYVPTRSYLKMPIWKLMIWLIPLLIAIPVAGGMFCHAHQLPVDRIIGFVTFFLLLIYVHTIQVPAMKSGGLFLAISAMIACIKNLSIGVDIAMCYDWGLEVSEQWMCIYAGVFFNAACYLVGIIAVYPMTGSIRTLVEEERFNETWYVFWVIPVLFITLNFFIRPQQRSTLYTGRLWEAYIAVGLTLLVLLIMFYLLFFVVASTLSRNARMQQENQFYNRQQERYDSLRIGIEEARQARHDLRHHFSQLYAMADDGDLEGIKSYCREAAARVPKIDMTFSDNRAVDSIIGYYCALARREGTPFTAQVDIPAEIPVNEMDMCLVLSNLLENALDASRRTDPARRQIEVEAYLYSSHLVLMQVTNTFDGTVEESGGAFLSSKRKGKGVGLQSVRRIAAKNGGTCSFQYDGGVFIAKAILRS